MIAQGTHVYPIPSRTVGDVSPLPPILAAKKVIPVTTLLMYVAYQALEIETNTMATKQLSPREEVKKVS